MKERYHISGMTCSACSAHVEKAIRKLAGVSKVSVNLLTETMELEYDPGQLDRETIEQAVKKAGYGADFIIGGAGRSGGVRTSTGGTAEASASSAVRAEAASNNTGTGIEGGVASGVTAEKTGTAGSEGDGAEGTGSRTGGRPITVGKNGKGRDSLQKKAREEDRAMKLRLGISIVFWIPLMYVAMYHMFNEWFGLPIPGFIHRFIHGSENAMAFAMTQFLLMLPIVYMNRKFFAVGFKTLRHLSPNMDSLIAIGASAAIGYGIFAMYRIGFGLGHGDWAVVEQYSHDLYFESAGTILTLITVGKYLESRSKGKTSEAITKLMDLSPKTAIVLDAEGREREIPTEALNPGDIFLLKPGSQVPVDGTVLEGNSSVDEAAITGESIPVEKQAGDKVVSATVNKAGFLKCRADRVGEDTTLAQIIRLVEEASASKVPIAQLADQVAGVFVPTVMGIALVTLLVWLIAGAGAEFAISSAIAVLVISCPCALGLATPVAIMVGIGVGANHGILIKSGEALQQAKEIDTVVVDKTGTLTSGRLKVMGVGCYVQDLSMETLLQLAAALEKRSEHPLAEAVVEHAEREGLEIPQIRDFRAVFGRGVEGVLTEDIPPRPLTPFTEKEAEKLRRMAEKRSGQGEKAIAETLRLDGADGPTAVFLAGKDEKGGAVAEFLNRKDSGAKAGTRYFVGNLAYMEENGIQPDPMVLEALNRSAEEGRTPLLVAEEGRLLGSIDVEDEIKESSYEAVQKFRELGIRVVMLTGDNRRTAEAVRQQLGIEEVVAEVLPQEKEQKISSLRSAGRKTAMIGDGINDAPALAAADVGMAIGAGTDVAMESADIVLMKSDLRDAVTAVKLSRAVIRNIKQNLFWAFFYNAIGIPLAAGVWYPLFGIRLNPMFGAAAMSLSSIFVVTNALRLKGFKSGFAERRKGGSLAEEPAGEQGNTSRERFPERENEIEEQAVRPGGEDLKETAAASSQASGETNESSDRQKNKKESEEKKMTKVMTIEGMMCGHCTGRVQKALEALEGVSAVTMSLEEKTATVELAAEVSDEALTGAVTEAGYEVKAIA
ncbi:MAG: heavy metal translocating P-type ATPase [Roseburia sp.]|nr:heavy metal translocating P-type ATPase [Roseburia sp.]MCM1097089.1 heavy metal translocating P-type ATPase [Ruminococcus flavefaciens]